MVKMYKIYLIFVKQCRIWIDLETEYTERRIVYDFKMKYYKSYSVVWFACRDVIDSKISRSLPSSRSCSCVSCALSSRGFSFFFWSLFKKASKSARAESRSGRFLLFIASSSRFRFSAPSSVFGSFFGSSIIFVYRRRRIH